MNNWTKLSIIAVLATPVWIATVKLVDMSRSPEEIRYLRQETREGFKQVNSRLDYFIGHVVTNDSTAVGRNQYGR